MGWRIIILLLLTTTCFAQKKVASINVSNTVAYAGVDRPGDLYVILNNGEALKFDKNGKQIGKRKLLSVPTVFDPKDGTRAFAYYRDTQTIETVAPDLSFADASPLHPEFAVNAWLVCPSKNELWILDSADFTLKKTKEKGTAIAYETAFGDAGATYMREYLNFLFVLDGDGIRMQNNLGKTIQKIAAPNLSYFSFLGEEMYYLSSNSLQLVDLYTSEKRQVALPHTATFALLTDDRMILVNDKSIDFFEFTP
jgi:hypothetical protein